MAIWDRNKVLPSALNSGNEYVEGDFPTEETLNAANNNAFYSVDFTEALADAPDNTEVGNIGTPAVTLIDNVKTIDGVSKTFKKFKFANLKGEKGDAGINDALVVQTFGTSTEDAISQKVITDKFDELDDQLNAVPISDTSYGLIEAFENAETAVMQNLLLHGLTVTNLITNGNFENGLIGYRLDGSGSSSTWTLNTVNPINGTQDGKLAITTGAWLRPALAVTPNTIIGHKYYFSFDYKVNSGKFTLHYKNGSTASYGVDIIGSGKVTIYITALAIDDLGLYFSTPDGTEIQIDNVSLIDLTAHNIASYDLATCQSKFPSYFDGTKSVDKGEVTVGTGTAITRARYPKLQSVPAIQDTYNVLSGLYTQNVQRYVLTADDIVEVGTDNSLLDYIGIAKKASYIGYGNIEGLVGSYVFGNMPNVDVYALYGTFDNLGMINNITGRGTSNLMHYGIIKSSMNLAAAKTALTGTVIYYQLATPILTYYPPKSIPLEVNSSIIHQSIMSDIAFYATEIAISDSDYPISALQEVMKVNVDTGAETPIDISTCTVASGGLSFTSTALTDGDLVWFRYEHTLDSATPTTEYTYTTSLSGGLTTIQQDVKNTNDNLQKQIDELRAIIASMAV